MNHFYQRYLCHLSCSYKKDIRRRIEFSKFTTYVNGVRRLKQFKNSSKNPKQDLSSSLQAVVFDSNTRAASRRLTKRCTFIQQSMIHTAKNNPVLPAYCWPNPSKKEKMPAATPKVTRAWFIQRKSSGQSTYALDDKFKGFSNFKKYF